MISLVFDGKCKGCTQADLELIEADAFMTEKLWGVRCIHNDACEYMEDRTIERLKGSNK